MMLQRKGLLSVVGAILVLAVVSLAFPDMALAQSQQAVRVKIQKVSGPDDAVFGDVLLVKDGDNAVLFGLVQSVPANSLVNLTIGSVDIKRTATYPGKFPSPKEDPIRFSGKEKSATLVATYPTNEGVKSATATVSLDFLGKDVRRDTPHRLLPIIEETSAAVPSTGYVLLTQGVIGTGAEAYIVDRFEGISGSGSALHLQSFPAFSTVEVYSTKVDVNNPDRSKRIAVVATDSFVNGDFVSDGSFAPFQVVNANSNNKTKVPSVLWLLVKSRPGKTVLMVNRQEYFLARINNDVDAELVW